MNTLFSALTAIPDPRKGNRLTYPLDYILLVVFCAAMSGFSSWYEIEHYAKIYERDLKKLYKRITKRMLDSYTPSHDTYAYVFRSLDPVKFQEAFKTWLGGVVALSGQHISIDGKTMRGVKKLDDDSECHAVSAYAKGARVCIDQVFISKKKNEIPAIKELLDLLDLKGCTVTIDAMGTQRDIVKKIVGGEANYLMNVKGNQPGTLLELEEHFKPAYKNQIVRNTSIDQGHGRVETRTMESLVDLTQFKELEMYKDLDKWEGIQSIHKMTRVRHEKRTQKETREVSYFISSLKDAETVFNLIRDHWGIENNLHYCLDVIMGEDMSAKRKGNEAKNWNVISKIALFFLEMQKKKTGIALKTLRKVNAAKCPSEILKFEYQ